MCSLSRADAPERLRACLRAAGPGSAVFVSACLVGKRCRYDGTAARSEAVCRLVDALRARGVRVRLVCPECSARLGRPREPAELRADGRVVTRTGLDVTERFYAGAAAACAAVEAAVPVLVVLKAKSPSCGVYEVYDGSFSATLRPGRGIAAERLVQAGWPVVDERDVEAFGTAADGV